MTQKTLRQFAFVLTTVLVTGLFFYTLLPYVIAIVFSAVLAILVYPWYERLSARFGPGHRAAAGTFTMTLIVIVLPLSLLVFWITQASTDLYATLQSGDLSAMEAVISPIEGLVGAFLPDVEWTTTGLLAEFVAWISTHFGNIFAATVHAAVSFFVGLILFYFFIKDGCLVRAAAVARSPLGVTATERILTRVRAMVDSVMRVNLLTSVFQGVMAAIGFWVFGVPNPILWGTVTGFLSLIPALGATSVMVIAAVYLFYASGWLLALGLLVWAALLVGVAEDVLRPYLVGRYNNIHPGLVLVSVLGGLATFGILGLVLGPIILALFLAMIDSYQAEFGGRKGAK